MSLQLTHGLQWWWQWWGEGGWLACFLHLARDVITPTDSDLQCKCNRHLFARAFSTNSSRAFLQTQAVRSCLGQTCTGIIINHLRQAEGFSLQVHCQTLCAAQFTSSDMQRECFLFQMFRIFSYFFIYSVSERGKIHLCKCRKKRAMCLKQTAAKFTSASEQPRWFTFPQKQHHIPVVGGSCSHWGIYPSGNRRDGLCLNLDRNVTCETVRGFGVVRIRCVCSVRQVTVKKSDWTGKMTAASQSLKCLHVDPAAASGGLFCIHTSFIHLSQQNPFESLQVYIVTYNSKKTLWFNPLLVEIHFFFSPETFRT